jgi:hypothetical protein
MGRPVGYTVYHVRINGSPVTDFIFDAELAQGFGKHDMAFLRVLMKMDHPAPWKLRPWPDGAAVEIQWGRNPVITTWYGYISHHTQQSEDDNGTHAPQITYVCLGTSKPMNSDRNRTWGGGQQASQWITPTYVAKRIAREHGLRAVVTPGTWRLDYEVQAAESDFGFLCRLADKVGYRFWVSGATLYFVDPLTVLAGVRHLFVPRYHIDKVPGFSDTAVDLQVSQGDSLPGATAGTRAIYGFDPGTHGLYRATAGGGPVQITNTSRQPKSYWEAKNLVSASQSLSQFWLGGTVTLRGYPLLYPGKVIEIDGARLPGQKSGFWLVTGVHHLLRQAGLPNPVLDKYETRASIVTNTTAHTPAGLKSVQRVIPEFTRCVLDSQKRWRSTSMSVVREAVL